MAIQNLGYRPIRELKTAADYKLLNDTLRSLWVKVLGNIGSKDINGEISSELSGAFGDKVNVLATRVQAIEQLNSEQNGRLLALEQWKDETQAKLAELLAWQEETKNKLTEIAAWQTATDERLTGIETRLAALEGK